MLTCGCSFRENGRACADEPVYLVELADCTACRDEGFAHCAGHNACITHGAEARSDEYLFDADASDLTITRIRSLAAS